MKKEAVRLALRREITRKLVNTDLEVAVGGQLDSCEAFTRLVSSCLSTLNGEDKTPGGK